MADVAVPHDYKIFFLREDDESRVCIRDSHTIKAWTAQEAVFQFEVLTKGRYANDRYFRVLEIEPIVPDGSINRQEWIGLIHQICRLCRNGKDELIKDARGGYAHRSRPGAILDNCDARILHEILKTEVKVCLKDED